MAFSISFKSICASSIYLHVIWKHCCIAITYFVILLIKIENNNCELFSPWIIPRPIIADLETFSLCFTIWCQPLRKLLYHLIGWSLTPTLFNTRMRRSWSTDPNAFVKYNETGITHFPLAIDLWKSSLNFNIAVVQLCFFRKTNWFSEINCSYEQKCCINYSWNWLSDKIRQLKTFWWNVIRSYRITCDFRKNT